MVKMATIHIARGNGKTNAEGTAASRESILCSDENVLTLKSLLPKMHDEPVMRHLGPLMEKLNNNDLKKASTAIMGITLKLLGNGKYSEDAHSATKELLNKKPQAVRPEMSTLIKTLETANAFENGSNATEFLSGVETIMSHMALHKPNEPLTRLVVDRINDLTKRYIDAGREVAAVKLVSEVLPNNAKFLENPSSMIDIAGVFSKDLGSMKQNGNALRLRT